MDREFHIAGKSTIAVGLSRKGDLVWERLNLCNPGRGLGTEHLPLKKKIFTKNRVPNVYG